MTQILCVGQAVEDYIFRVSEMPALAAKHQAKSFESVGGGPAANAAVAIQRLGGSAHLAARLGDDKVGASIVSGLEHEGINCRLMRRFSGAQSSVSAVMVDDDGQRMIVNFLDSDLPTNPAWLLDGFPKEVDAVLADTRWPEGAVACLKKAKAMNKPAVLDADHPIPNNSALLESATHLAFSAEGLFSFLKEPDLEKSIKRVASDFGVWCCVTDGANGVFTAHGHKFSHFPAPQVRAVDTLGAGDIWHGAFCLSLAEGMDEGEAVQFAIAAAALKVTKMGGRSGAPTRDEISLFLGNDKLEITS